MKGEHDIVYVLKNDVQPDELRYSLRSAVRNFRFRRVWFYGGCPAGITPDGFVPVVQYGATKWERTRGMYRAIMENDDITPQFYLFNDDFFIMGKYEQDVPVYNGTLQEQADRVARRVNRSSRYIRRLEDAARTLEADGFGSLCYDVHTPMLIDRGAAIEVLDRYTVAVPFRSAYGNMLQIGGVMADDVKVAYPDDEPPADAVLLSTTDESFAVGRVGSVVRDTFKRRCRFEDAGRGPAAGGSGK